jgi:hypothetical protein
VFDDLAEVYAETIGERLRSHPGEWFEGVRIFRGKGRRVRDRDEVDVVKRPKLTAAERKQRDQIAARLRWERFRDANPEHIAAYRKKWAAAHPEKEREYDRRGRAKTKADPRRLALFAARIERYREKRNARKRQRHRDDPAWAEKERARLRQWARQNYAATYKPEGKRKCTLCGLPGHNRVRCGRVPPSGSSAPRPSDEPVVQAGGDAAARNNFGIALQNLLGGGGALPVEERNGTTPPPAGRVGRPAGSKANGPGAGPARVAVIRDQIERGVYVPFAELRRQIAQASNATLPSLWQSAPVYDWRAVARRKKRRAPPTPEEMAATREQARVRMRLARVAARAAPAEARP